MGVKASTWAWEQELPYAEKLVLLALADHADDSGVCWPSLKHLKKKTGIDHTRISKLIKSMKDRGLIEVTHRKAKGLQRSNKYKLRLGLMIIPVVPTTTGHLSPEQPITCPQSKLETSLETSIEPSNGETFGPADKTSDSQQKQEGDKIMKQFGKGDVEEALKGSITPEEMDLTHLINSMKKKGTRYTVASVRKLWAYLNAQHVFGFLPAWTKKEEGQINQIQDKLGDISITDVLPVVFAKWHKFTTKTGVYKPPPRPNVAFLLKHVGVAGQMALEHLQPIAQVDAEPTFNLTNTPKTTDNKTNETDQEDLLAELDKYDV
jgi:hypothetical protein